MIKGKVIQWSIIYDSIDENIKECREFLRILEGVEKQILSWGKNPKMFAKRVQKEKEDLAKIRVTEQETKGKEGWMEESKRILEENLKSLLEKLKCGQIDERNFYAHAGMEKNVTFVYVDEETWIGYNIDCWKKVKKCILNRFSSLIFLNFAINIF